MRSGSDKNFLSSVYVPNNVQKPDDLDVLIDGMTAAHFAAYEGNTGLLNHMSQEELSKEDEDGCSAIHYLMRRRDAETIKALLDCGKIAEGYKDSKGNNLLHLACLYGCDDIIVHLLQLKGLDKNALNSDKDTALNIAFINNHKNLETLDLLKQNGCKINRHNIKFSLAELKNIQLIQWFNDNISEILPELELKEEQKKSEAEDALLKQSIKQDNIRFCKDNAQYNAILLNRPEALKILCGDKKPDDEKLPINKDWFYIALSHGNLGVLKVLLENAKPVDILQDLNKRDDSWLYRYDGKDSDYPFDLRKKIWYNWERKKQSAVFYGVGATTLMGSLTLAVQEAPILFGSPLATFFTGVFVAAIITHSTTNLYTDYICTPRLIKQLQDLESKKETAGNKNKVDEAIQELTERFKRPKLSDVQKQFLAACIKRDVESVSNLLGGDDKDNCLNSATINGLQGVHLAALFGHYELLKLFAPNVLETALGKNGRTPFALALLGNNKDTIEYFMTQVLHVKSKDANNHSPLTVLLRYGTRENIDAWISKNFKYYNLDSLLGILGTQETVDNLFALSHSKMSNDDKTENLDTLFKCWDMEYRSDQSIRTDPIYEMADNTDLLDMLLCKRPELVHEMNLKTWSCDNHLNAIEISLKYTSKLDAVNNVSPRHLPIAKALLKHIQDDSEALSQFFKKAPGIWSNQDMLSKAGYYHEKKMCALLSSVSACAVLYLACKNFGLEGFCASILISPATFKAVEYLYQEYRLKPTVVQNILEL
ncbi:MAG: ankyrin repeat domain-containing protein [Alphaproteobacteria bacterium]